jgi:hypothetical protein
MKSVGFLAAIACGILSSAVHYKVLQKNLASQSVQMTQYMVMFRDVMPGEVLDKDSVDLVEIPSGIAIPAVKVKDFSVYEGVATVRRAIGKGQLLLHSDITGVAPGLNIQGDSGRGLSVSLSGIAFEPSLVRVGRQVGFLVDEEQDGENSSEAVGQFREIGPFLILGIGDLVADESKGESALLTVDASVVDGVLDEKSGDLLSAMESQRLRGITIYPESLNAKQ